MPPNTYYNGIIIIAAQYLKNSKWADDKKSGKKETYKHIHRFIVVT